MFGLLLSAQMLTITYSNKKMDVSIMHYSYTYNRQDKAKKGNCVHYVVAASCTGHSYLYNPLHKLNVNA